MHKNKSTTDHKVSADALVESSREPVREIFCIDEAGNGSCLARSGPTRRR